MNKYYLVDTNGCRCKYRRIDLRLHHSNNADKKFHATIAKFEFLNNPIRYSKETNTVIWISTQPISNYYGDKENVITF